MKITAIESHVCHARRRNRILVKVVTDQPGLRSRGGATKELHPL
jgi:galactonate dehydratase